MAASLSSILAIDSLLDLGGSSTAGLSITFPVIGLTSVRRRRRLPGS